MKDVLSYIFSFIFLNLGFITAAVFIVIGAISKFKKSGCVGNRFEAGICGMVIFIFMSISLYYITNPMYERTTSKESYVLLQGLIGVLKFVANLLCVKVMLKMDGQVI